MIARKSSSSSPYLEGLSGCHDRCHQVMVLGLEPQVASASITQMAVCVCVCGGGGGGGVVLRLEAMVCSYSGELKFCHWGSLVNPRVELVACK